MDLRKPNAEGGVRNAESMCDPSIPHSTFRIPHFSPAASSAITFTVPSSFASLPRTHRSGSPQLAPREPEAVAPAHPHQVLDRSPLEPGRRAAYEVTDTPIGTVSIALLHDFARRILTPIPYEPEPDPHCGKDGKDGRGGTVSAALAAPAAPAVLNRTIHIAQIDIRQPDRDAVTLGVAPQRVERVESHRLVVEKRASVLGGVIMPEPRRLVRE